MLTPHDILCAVLLPAVVALAIGGAGLWRRWNWVMPLAIGAGFIAGYATSGIPKFPPRDGTDWLFWLAFPVAIVAAVAECFNVARWFGWIAGVVVWIILRPLPPTVVPAGVLWGLSAAVAVIGFGLVFAIDFAQTRIPSPWLIGAMTLAAGAGSVIVMSSNLRIVGVYYGLALAGAAAPIIAVSWRLRGATGAALAIWALLAGIMGAGRFYPDPGVTWVNFWVTLLSPLLCIGAAVLPLPRPWQRGLAAIAAVAIAVGSVAMPTALAAKQAAENPDPYSEMLGS